MAMQKRYRDIDELLRDRPRKGVAASVAPSMKRPPKSMAPSMAPSMKRPATMSKAAGPKETVYENEKKAAGPKETVYENERGRSMAPRGAAPAGTVYENAADGSKRPMSMAPKKAGACPLKTLAPPASVAVVKAAQETKMVDRMDRYDKRRSSGRDRDERSADRYRRPGGFDRYRRQHGSFPRSVDPLDLYQQEEKKKGCCRGWCCCCSCTLIIAILIILAVAGAAVWHFVFRHPATRPLPLGRMFVDSVCDDSPVTVPECAIGPPPSKDSCNSGTCTYYKYEMPKPGEEFDGVNGTRQDSRSSSDKSDLLCEMDDGQFGVCNKSKCVGPKQPYGEEWRQDWNVDGKWVDNCDEPNPCWDNATLFSNMSVIAESPLVTREDCINKNRSGCSGYMSAVVWLQHLRCKHGKNRTASAPCQGLPFKLRKCAPCEQSPPEMANDKCMVNVSVATGLFLRADENDPDKPSSNSTSTSMSTSTSTTTSSTSTSSTTSTTTQSSTSTTSTPQTTTRSVQAKNGVRCKGEGEWYCYGGRCLQVIEVDDKDDPVMDKTGCENLKMDEVI